MKHEVQVSILKELMSQLDEGRNADAGVMFRNPTSVYTDPELAEPTRNAFVEYANQIDHRACSVQRGSEFFSAVQGDLNYVGIGQQPQITRVIATSRQNSYLDAARRQSVGQYGPDEATATGNRDDVVFAHEQS